MNRKFKRTAFISFYNIINVFSVYKLRAVALFACISFTNHALPVSFLYVWWSLMKKTHDTHYCLQRPPIAQKNTSIRKPMMHVINKSINHVEHIKALVTHIEIHKRTDLVKYTKGMHTIIWHKLWEYDFTQQKFTQNHQITFDIQMMFILMFLSPSADPDLHPQTEPIKRPTSESHQLSRRQLSFITVADPETLLDTWRWTPAKPTTGALSKAPYRRGQQKQSIVVLKQLKTDPKLKATTLEILHIHKE